MKALVKKEKALGIWLEEVPVPEVKENEVLIKTIKTAICGTDLHIYKWDDWAQKTITTPLVIGHEYMGEIVEIGKSVKELKKGMRVSGEGHITCGECVLCKSGKRHLCPHTKGLGVQRHGCFAEYFTLPAENIFPLPDSISDDMGAIFDPLGNAVHSTLSFDLAGEDVLITGSGPIGMMCAAIAKHVGARHVVVANLIPYRLELAKKLGATATVNIKENSISQMMHELAIVDGFTIGLEMSGHPDGLAALLENLQPGGKIALLGILPSQTAINWNHVIFKMLTIKGIYGREIFSTWYKMSHMLEGGLDITPIITHQFSYREFQKGFDVMSSGISGKVILNWKE